MGRFAIHEFSGIAGVLTFVVILVIMLIFAFDVRHPEKKIVKMDEKGEHNKGFGWFLAIFLSIITAIPAAGLVSGIVSNL